MEEMIMGSNNGNTNNSIGPRPANQLQVNNMERRLVRPQKEQALNCPRCNSTNTKFCYYNNYSLTQPRYFCKTCKRYWTEGGSLRNVPVGGGSRKNKKPSSSSVSSTSSLPAIVASNASLKMATEGDPSISSTQNPKFHGGQDLNLAFPPLPEFGGCTVTTTSTSSNASAMGLNLNPFVPLMHPMVPIMPEYPSEYYRSNTLGFPLDVGVGGEAGGSYESTGGRLLFPFEETREVNNPNANASAGEGADQFEHDVKVGAPHGFWSGMINGGGGSSAW